MKSHLPFGHRTSSAQPVYKLQAKTAYDKKGTACESSRYYRNLFPLCFITGKIGKHGPVRNIHDRVSHSPQNIEYCCVYIHSFCTDSPETGEQQNIDHYIHQCANHQPRFEFSKAASCVIHDRAHKNIIQCIPNSGDKKHGSYKSCVQSQNICKIHHDIDEHQLTNHIFPKSTQSI